MSLSLLDYSLTQIRFFDTETGKAVESIAAHQATKQKQLAESKTSLWQTMLTSSVQHTAATALFVLMCVGAWASTSRIHKSKWRNIWIRDVFCYRISAPLVPGVPTRPRLDSSIKKCDPHLIYDTALQVAHAWYVRTLHENFTSFAMLTEQERVVSLYS